MPLARLPVLSLACVLALQVAAQVRPEDALALIKDRLDQHGFVEGDLADVVLKDHYVSDGSGTRHTFIRQRWLGVEVWNGDIGIHQAPDGRVVQLNIGAFTHMAKRVRTTEAAISGPQALALVLARTAPGIPLPEPVAVEDGGRRLLFDGTHFNGEPVVVQLFQQPMGDSLRLVWNVNHYLPDGSHWWNVRIDAVTGEELDRNDWVVHCDFGHGGGHVHDAAPGHAPEEEAPAPMGPNDYRVYGWPVESPSHGARTVRTAPWLDGGIASPFGWHDTNGAAGAEFTDTRGNNVRAQEDADANNTGGYRPSGGATLQFDFPLDLTQAPNTYWDAAITNLFYWNNVMHDVWYQYGFTEPSGNFQQNNYGRGGLGNDWVNADAQDGSGTNNANFATPVDGSPPRMQMFRWTYTTPNRDSDLDNGVIVHEYGHGISNRLVGGPGNTSCLTNAEQMGEGWSDWLSLIMTIKAGDTGPMGRGIGTYLLGQPTTGVGIRPARYSTSFAVNNYTYAATNNTATISQPHGIGFIWCTILWEMTWELIGVYGLDPNIYTGTGGNNIAMRLVIEGMKLTPCNPGFVDARNAILQADQNLYGGANQGYLWAAFARRGLGVSASQGSPLSRTDQVQAFDTPMANNVGIFGILTPPTGTYSDCGGATATVSAVVRNYGTNPQTNVPVRYRLNSGTWVNATVPGTLAPGASVNYSFSVPLTLPGVGTHTLTVATNMAGDMYAPDNTATATLTIVAGTTIAAPFLEGLAVPGTTPPGWTLQNPDNGYTWTSNVIGMGPNCASNRVWIKDCYNDAAMGQEDRLITPLVNLGGLTQCKLRFDHAYVRYNASYSDAFRVDISTNCGANWTTLFQQAGAVLATAPDNTAAWQPTQCTHWRNNEVDLGAYDGQVVMLRFVTINGYGNNFYMDNVEVIGTLSVLPVELVSLRATPGADGISVEWTTASEHNSDRFEVERATTPDRWERIGVVNAAGNSLVPIDYTWLDRQPHHGWNFYRLNQVDTDGGRQLSTVVSAEWKLPGAGVHPNPNDGTFFVQRAQASDVLEVTDATGRRVGFTLEPVGDSRSRVVLRDAAPGIYLVRMGAGSGAVQERVVVTVP